MRITPASSKVKRPKRVHEGQARAACQSPRDSLRIRAKLIGTSKAWAQSAAQM